MQCVDEHYSNSLSLMVNRIKFDFNGDPRYFLVERKFNLKNSVRSEETKSEDLAQMLVKDDREIYPSLPKELSGNNFSMANQLDSKFQSGISPLK